MKKQNATTESILHLYLFYHDHETLYAKSKLDVEDTYGKYPENRKNYSQLTTLFHNFFPGFFFFFFFFFEDNFYWRWLRREFLMKKSKKSIIFLLQNELWRKLFFSNFSSSSPFSYAYINNRRHRSMDLLFRMLYILDWQKL